LKRSFALLTTLILVITLSILSISLIETRLLSSNVNKLKYLHLQALIYINELNSYVLVHDENAIIAYVNDWNDERYSISIVPDESNSSIYYTSIQTVDDSHIRLSQKILK